MKCNSIITRTHTRRYFRNITWLRSTRIFKSNQQSPLHSHHKSYPRQPQSQYYW